MKNALLLLMAVFLLPKILFLSPFPLSYLAEKGLAARSLSDRSPPLQPNSLLARRRHLAGKEEEAREEAETRTRVVGKILEREGSGRTTETGRKTADEKRKEKSAKENPEEERRP